MWILAELRRIIPADLQVDGPMLVVQGPHREAPVRGRVDGGVPALERVLLRREPPASGPAAGHLPGMAGSLRSRREERPGMPARAWPAPRPSSASAAGPW